MFPHCSCTCGRLRVSQDRCVESGGCGAHRRSAARVDGARTRSSLEEIIPPCLFLFYCHAYLDITGPRRREGTACFTGATNHERRLNNLRCEVSGRSAQG